MATKMQGASAPAVSADVAARPAKQKLAYLEVARVTCVFFVVVAHATDISAMRSGSSGVTVFVSTLIRFVVPAFFMISGYLIGVKHRDPAYRLDVRRFWSSRALSLILPFVLWNVVYFWMFTLANGGSIRDPWALFGLLTGEMHLYFIFVLLQFFVLYTLLARWFGPRLLAWVLGLSAVSSVAFYGVSEYLLWTSGADGRAFEWHWGKLCLAWALFFVWGIWLGYRPGAMEWMRRRRWWLLAAAGVLFVPYHLEMRYQVAHFGAVSRDFFLLSGLPYQFVGACALLGVFAGWEEVWRRSVAGRTIVAWGALMFGVYVAHVAVVHYADPLWQKVWPHPPQLVEIALLTSTAFFVTLAIVWACGTRYLWPVGLVLFGGRGRKRRGPA